MAALAGTGKIGKQRATTGPRLFEAVVMAFREAEPDVERVKLFGYDCLRFAGKVFAKVDKGRLVMKLPEPRIEALMSAGQLRPYEGKRGELKAWVVVDTVDEQLVVNLAEEARVFVGAGICYGLTP